MKTLKSGPNSAEFVCDVATVAVIFKKKRLTKTPIG